MSLEAPLQRQQIADLIPHQGNMCLLDTIVRWDDEEIAASAVRHHDPDNPLLREGELRCIVLIEYAAQAAAVHAALTEGSIGEGEAAFIGAVRSLKLHRQLIDRNCRELEFQARCILNDPSGAIYQLTAHSGQELLMESRVVMVLP